MLYRHIPQFHPAWLSDRIYSQVHVSIFNMKTNINGFLCLSQIAIGGQPMKKVMFFAVRIEIITIAFYVYFHWIQ